MTKSAFQHLIVLCREAGSKGWYMGSRECIRDGNGDLHSVNRSRETNEAFVENQRLKYLLLHTVGSLPLFYTLNFLKF